ncbi:MAG: PAS domain-containing protein, partial [Pseudomonadota bacterium]
MSPSSPKTERYFKDRYTTRYLIAFGLIAATVIAGAFQLYRVLEINHEQAEILQVAGAQGKLSQRLALLTPRVIEAPNAFRQKRALNDMRVAVELMRAGHSFLTSPNERGIIPAQSSPELIHHYAPEGRGLERMAESFIEAFERFLDDPVGMENTIEFHRVNAETGLLVRLNQAMGLYGDVARQMNRDAINLLILWVALALLLLVVEIAFIFNPMARDAARSMAKMSAELDERTSLLSRSLRIANMGHWRAVNRDSDPIWLSRELLDMYGMEREEGFVPLAVIQEGDVIAEDTAIEDNTQHVAFKRTWETGEPTVAQSMYRKPNGEIIEMLVHMAAEKDDDGNVSAVTGVIRDVTEEAKADRALRDSLELVKDKSASLEEAQRLARSGSWRRPLDVDKLEMDGRCYELLKFDPGT